MPALHFMLPSPPPPSPDFRLTHTYLRLPKTWLVAQIILISNFESLSFSDDNTWWTTCCLHDVSTQETGELALASLLTDGQTHSGQHLWIPGEAPAGLNSSAWQEGWETYHSTGLWQHPELAYHCRTESRGVLGTKTCHTDDHGPWGLDN